MEARSWNKTEPDRSCLAALRMQSRRRLSADANRWLHQNEPGCHEYDPAKHPADARRPTALTHGDVSQSQATNHCQLQMS